MTIKEVAIVTGMCFNESYHSDLPEDSRWHFSLHGVEVKEGKLIGSAFGAGKTLAAAKKSYAEQLQSKLIVVHSMRPDRHELMLPPKITSR